MSANNRIQATSMSVTVPRQTPHNEFGTMLAASLGEAADRGASLVGLAAGMTPVASTAISGVGSLGRSVASVSAAPVVSLGGGAVGVPGSTTPDFGGLGGDSGYGPLLQQISGKDPSEAAYLQLQMKMNRESQQYSTVSNIMKVRSDSAKAAINNIR